VTLEIQAPESPRPSLPSGSVRVRQGEEGAFAGWRLS
jgi:hypothetical protein